MAFRGEVVVKNSLTKEEKVKPRRSFNFCSGYKIRGGYKQSRGLEEDVVKQLRDIDEEEKVLLYLFIILRGNDGKRNYFSG